MRASVRATSLQSRPTLCDPWTPLSMGFSRQEHCSGLPCPLQGICLTQGSNPVSHTGRQVLYHESCLESPRKNMRHDKCQILDGERAEEHDRVGDTWSFKSSVLFHFSSCIVQSIRCNVFKTSVCIEFIIVILEKIPTFTHNYRSANIAEGLISQKKKKYWCGRRNASSFEAFLFQAGWSESTRWHFTKLLTQRILICRDLGYMKKEQLILGMKVIIQIQRAFLARDEHRAWICTTFSGNTWA